MLRITIHRNAANYHLKAVAKRRNVLAWDASPMLQITQTASRNATIGDRLMSTHHGILLHVVFSTKYRERCLHDEWRDELFAYIGGVVQDHKSTLLKAGGIEDHVHLLLRIHPQFAISSTVQLPKSNSSRWINEERKLTERFEWHYGAFSVSQSVSEKVKGYIANQRKHHSRTPFCDEYLSMLDQQGIEYDPKFVFESEFVG
jgi:putative transposase